VLFWTYNVVSIDERIPEISGNAVAFQ
jgi:hypothetical protein